MVPINCAALPEPLLESEDVRPPQGRVYGADRDKPGLLETANGGTLFLDELTEMSLPLQAKLLRVIQDGVVRRVGSENQDAVVDVRCFGYQPRAAGRGQQRRSARRLVLRLQVVPIKLPRFASGRRTSRFWPTTSSPITGNAIARWATDCPS